jgi:hypothetical protein
MADIAVQFHALPAELRQFVKDVVQDFDLHVVAMRFFPFDAIRLTRDDLDCVFADDSPYAELAFTLGPANLPVKSNTDFFDRNPSRLRLDIQRVTEKGLRQTWMSARTDDKKSFAIWSKVRKRLKEMTESGVTVTNPVSGASTHSRSFRYTAGAKAAEMAGITMLQAAGTCVVKFDLA